MLQIVRFGLLGGLLLMTLAGCGQSEAPASAPGTAASLATIDPSLVTISATQEDLSVTAADGLLLRTTLYAPGRGRPAPGVILLHMLGSTRAAWKTTGLVDALLANGMAVMTVDMRGHGETGGTADWTLAADDLQRVWDTFAARPEIDGKRTAVVGASIGANVALATAAEQPAIQTAILLSPGLDYRGVTTADQLATYGDRPLLIVASNEDSYAADSSRTLAEQAGAAAQLTLYEGAGHGTQMFNREPDLVGLIVAWLAERLTGR